MYIIKMPMTFWLFQKIQEIKFFKFLYICRFYIYIYIYTHMIFDKFIK